MGVEEEVDAPVALERPHVEVVMESADLVDPDHLAERLDHPEVGMRPGVDPSRVAQQRAGQGQGGRVLPDPGRAVEEVRVRRMLGEGGLEQPLGLGLLGDVSEGGHGHPWRPRRPAGAPSTTRYRSGNRPASAR